ncbi:MAG: DNA repair protein RadC [Candidatus Glassbacteria bacterium]
MKKVRGKNHTLPLEDGPRERFEGLGPGALSLSELLALLIGTGSEAASAVDVARNLVSKFGTLRGLDSRSLNELLQVKGMGPVKAMRLKAAFELGKRLMREKVSKRCRISCPEDVYNYLSPLLLNVKQEMFIVLLLNGQNELVKEVVVSKGGLTSSVVHPREVFREAIVESSAAVVLAHNHPSGNPFPSSEDHRVTMQLRKAGEVIGIEVFDHVIIGDGRFVSFREMGNI